MKISQWVEDELKNNREKEISKLKLKPSWKQRCFFETSLSLEYQVINSWITTEGKNVAKSIFDFIFHYNKSTSVTERASGSALCYFFLGGREEHF